MLLNLNRQEEDDDDLRRGRQVQELAGLRRADPEERGLHVDDEGRRRQRAQVINCN